MYAETCPQYLALDTQAPVGVLAKVNPPIREKGNSEFLWQGIRDGTVDVIGTDHATTLRAKKITGDPWRSAPGFAGVGTLLPVLLSHGVNGGRMGLGHIAQLQARAARILRLPNKGRIEPGADADLVVVDPSKERVVRAEELQSASDFSVFEGSSLKGWPVMTLLRGMVVAKDGAVVGQSGEGRYVAR